LYLELAQKLAEPFDRRTKHTIAALLGAGACTFALTAANSPPQDAAPDAAICPVVYRLDESPSPRGYHYAFFGNAFFINEQGYLLTDAHVLETFRDGGQPYLIVRRPNAPPRLLQATIVATDPPHDVAILRVTPNPFTGKYRVAFLPLATDPAATGQSVLALSLHPTHLQDAQSLEAPREDRSPGQVLSYESTQLEKSAPAARVFLLSHPVTRGQSGSPVLTSDCRAVVGIIEGRWLRSQSAAAAKSTAQVSAIPGAATPIEYAIALLQRQAISWHALPRPATASSVTSAGTAPQ
jgi:S1-C subfamily serine protease